MGAVAPNWHHALLYIWGGGLAAKQSDFSEDSAWHMDVATWFVLSWKVQRIVCAIMLAGVAGGLFANLQEAAAITVAVATYVESNLAHRQAYDDAYALYREVYDALQEPFRKAAKR